MSKVPELTYPSYLPEVVQFLETEEDVGKMGFAVKQLVSA